MKDLIKYYSKNNLITSKKIKYISNLYNQNPNKLLELYNEKFIGLIRNSYKKSAFYNALYKRHGINIEKIKDLSDINKLPIVRREDIKNKENEIYIGSELFKIKGFTSGTTGSPLTVFRTPLDITTEHAYLRQYRMMHGFENGDPLVSIRGKLGKDVNYDFDKNSNTLYISSVNINQHTIESYLSLIKDFKPKGIEAFPSYLFKLCIEIEKKKLSFNIPLSFTSSETMYEFQRTKIENLLQTKIFDWYGNVERTIGIAQDCHFNYYPLPLYSINEYMKDNIITTSLINTHFPLIRYAVDDVINVKSTDFNKNIVSPEIINIKGRAGDTLELKNGSSVGCIDHAFKGIDYLEIAQVHQKNTLTPIEIKLVVDSPFQIQQENQLKSNLVRMLGEETEITFTYCKRENLTYSANEKYKLIIKK